MQVSILTGGAGGLLVGPGLGGVVVFLFAMGTYTLGSTVGFSSTGSTGSAEPTTGPYLFLSKGFLVGL